MDTPSRVKFRAVIDIEQTEYFDAKKDQYNSSNSTPARHESTEVARITFQDESLDKLVEKIHAHLDVVSPKPIILNGF